ncbi:MAG: hypothetical protein EPN88_15045 [Bacteroidetes bacterium]|nr:MAG: hypothetical protein EPN88_15045 [Bacteroidota bacterium]
MKSNRILSIILLLSVNLLVKGQQPAVTWEKWNNLIGEWVGEGNGKPGQGEGTFSFQTDLDGKILTRKNHTVFPETSNSKALVHDDLMIVYQGTPGGSQEAIYFDNEGNTIKYNVSFTDNSIILTSDIKANVPAFRLSYVTIDSKTVNITFEMASPKAPEEFKTYLSGKAFKVK